MIKEFKASGIHPAEIISIITDTKSQDSSLIVYFDSRIYDILRRHCSYPEAKGKPSVKDLLKYLAYRLIETEAETPLTQHALQLQEYLPQENKDVLDKALRDPETLRILIDLFNKGLGPELLLEERCAEYTLILLDRDSIVTPITSGARSNKKLIWYPETTEIPQPTVGVTAHINNYCLLCLRQDHTTLLCPELPKFVEGRKQQTSQKENKGQLKCSHCSKVGHIKETCWSNPANPNKPDWLVKRQQVECHHCKKKGHIRRFCKTRIAESRAIKENNQGNGSSQPTGASREAPSTSNTQSI